MSSSVSAAENVQNKRQGMLGKLISLLIRILMILLFSLFLSVIFEWIGIYFFWNNEGWHHSEQMFKVELGWLNDSFKQSLLMAEPITTAHWLLDQAYTWGFEKTGFVEFTQKARYNSMYGSDISSTLSSVYITIEDYLMAIIYVTLTFVVRLSVLILSIPLFALASLTGITEGLVRRDLRRFGAGRESSFIYHRAKRYIPTLTVAPWLIYLSCPISVNPLLILMPCAFALGLAITITAATFKKYL